jgi:hypothetical protein
MRNQHRHDTAKHANWPKQNKDAVDSEWRLHQYFANFRTEFSALFRYFAEYLKFSAVFENFRLLSLRFSAEPPYNSRRNPG